jgi:hypothetical protein
MAYREIEELKLKNGDTLVISQTSERPPQFVVTNYDPQDEHRWTKRFDTEEAARIEWDKWKDY